MSPCVIQVRADICGDCPSPCAWQRDASMHGDACASCPSRRWGQWGACDQFGTGADIPGAGSVIAPAPAATLRGMGDVVAIIADPVARVVGLDKSKCGCGNRQAALNEAIPFGPTTDPGIVI